MRYRLYEVAHRTTANVVRPLGGMRELARADLVCELSDAINEIEHDNWLVLDTWKVRANYPWRGELSPEVNLGRINDTYAADNPWMFSAEVKQFLELGAGVKAPPVQA